MRDGLLEELKDFAKELDQDYKAITKGAKGLVSYAQYNRNIKEEIEEIINRYEG